MDVLEEELVKPKKENAGGKGFASDSINQVGNQNNSIKRL
jgi:hypothetical protein